MIKGRSALESLQQFGLANDGPLNKGGLGFATALPKQTVLERAMIVEPNGNPHWETVTDTPLAVTGIEPSVTDKRTHAQRQADYRKANADKIKERDKLRKAEARKGKA